VNLPAMGANANVPDIFIEIDGMHGADGGDHTHFPKFPALSAIAATFSSHGIRLHFDVGNKYQPNQIDPATGAPFGPLSFIVPAAFAQGGEILEENGAFLCPNAAVTNASSCVFNVPYSVLSWKTGLHTVKDGNPRHNLPGHFALNRKDAFHYV